MRITPQYWLPTAAVIALAVASCRSAADESQSPPPLVSGDSFFLGAKPAETQDAPLAASAPKADGTLRAKIGAAAPDFTLTDLNGKSHTLAQYKGKTVVLEWFSPGCPYCVYAYGEGSLKTMPEEYMKAGIVWLSINSEPTDRKNGMPETNRAFVEKNGMQAPLLLDPAGLVGRSYGAKSTPHVFVIDPKGVLTYQGALDNAPLGQTKDGAAMAEYVGDAVAAIKAGQKLVTTETKSYG